MIKALLIKELKNTLRDKRILLSVIIMPLIVFLIMGGIMRFAMTASFEETKPSKQIIYVVNEDKGVYAGKVVDYIKSKGFNVVVLENANPEELVKTLENVSLILNIPSGFTYNLTNGLKANIETYISLKGLSISGYAIMGLSSDIISDLNSYLSTELIKEQVKNVNPEFILNPVVSKPNMYIRNIKVPASAAAMLGFFSAGLIVAPLVLVTTAIGVAASLIAVENEERTLEVLLTLPISRFKILFSKLLGVMVLVILATISFTIGFIFYLSAPFAAIEETAPTGGVLSFEITPIMGIIGILSIILIIASIFLTLVAVSALGLLLGSIAPDVRTAQTYIGSLGFIVFVPGMLLMLLDLSKFPLAMQLILIGISPFIAPILIIKALFEGLAWIAYVSLAWTTVFTLLMVFVASKFISSERIFTTQFTLKMRALRKLGRK